MNYTSCVPRMANDQFVTIRASYVRVCNGNVVAAALISVFESWHNYKLKQIEEARRLGQPPPNTWQHHTGKELEAAIMGLGKRHSIDQAKLQLVSMGVIIVGRNPDRRLAFDATTHYCFQPDALGQLLAFVENSRRGPFVEIDISPDAENDKCTFADISTAIPNDTTDESADETIPADAGGGPKRAPVKKDRGQRPRERRPAAEKDHDWQAWVDRYEQHVRARNGDIGHHWTKAQLGPQGLKGLRAHLVKISTKVAGMTDDQCGYQAWCFILENWDLLDDWLRGQFDLCVVLKKITDILNRLNNGTQAHRGAAAGGHNGKLGTSAARNKALEEY